MKYTQLFETALLFTGIIFTSCAYSMDVQKMYGAQDADQLHTKIAREALVLMNVPRSHNITIKKLEPSLDLQESCLMTHGTSNQGGIWLKHPPAGKYDTDIVEVNSKGTSYAALAGAPTFVAYHEAAHIKLNHYIKQELFELLAQTGAFLATYGLIDKLLLLCGLDDQVKTLGVHLLAGLMTAYAQLKIPACSKPVQYLINAYLKSHEKEADLYAAQVLCQSAQATIVEEHISALKNLVKKQAELDAVQGRKTAQQRTGSTYPHVQEQIEYLQAYFQKYKKRIS